MLATKTFKIRLGSSGHITRFPATDLGATSFKLGGLLDGIIFAFAKVSWGVSQSVAGLVGDSVSAEDVRGASSLT